VSNVRGDDAAQGAAQAVDHWETGPGRTNSGVVEPTNESGVDGHVYGGRNDRHGGPPKRTETPAGIKRPSDGSVPPERSPLPRIKHAHSSAATVGGLGAVLPPPQQEGHDGQGPRILSPASLGCGPLRRRAVMNELMRQEWVHKWQTNNHLSPLYEFA
jgi:hypothetical protein